MEAACLSAMEQPGMMLGVTLTTPRGQKMPPGFPRGELLSENMLIEAVSETAPSRRARGTP